MLWTSEWSLFSCSGCRSIVRLEAVYTMTWNLAMSSDQKQCIEQKLHIKLRRIHLGGRRWPCFQVRVSLNGFIRLPNFGYERQFRSTLEDIYQRPTLPDHVVKSPAIQTNLQTYYIEGWMKKVGDDNHLRYEITLKLSKTIVYQT